MCWLSQAARIWQVLLIFPHLLHTEWGQGLSHSILRRVIAVFFSQLLPEAVLKTYPDTAPDLSALSDQLNNYQAIILGPGLGQNAASENIVRTVTASDIKIPLIIDADGLNILSKNMEWLSKSTVPTVITPHMKELSRLTWP